MTRLREMLLAVALVLVTTFVAAAPAWAQQGGASGGGPAATQGAPATGGQRSFLPPAGGAPRAAEPRADAGFIDRAYAWLTAVQGDFNQRLARAVRELKTGDPWVAIIAIAGLSFMYGVLHAIGPGHGKAIVSSYVLASDRTVRRGIALSFLAALFQAISALVLVALLVGIFNATGLAVKATEAWLETASWGLVVLVGVWLLWVQIGRLRAARRAKAEQASARHDGHHHDHAHSHGIGHAHAHAHAHASSHTHSHTHVGAAGGAALAHAHSGSTHTHRHAPAHGSHVHHHHGHDHRHAHAGHATGTGTQAHAHHHHEHHHHDGDCCGHAHMPAPKDLEGPWSWRKAVPLAFAIGIRPCTGAIAVLIFALSQGLVWAGVFATFAMAIGTAITVSVLAALAAGSRDLAVKLGGGDGGWGASIRSAAGIGGSLAVIGLGLMLFLGSLRAAAVF